MKIKNDINLEEIRILIAEVEKTKIYDRKRISEYHDRIFGKDNRVDSANSCLIMQMRQIKAWYQDQKKK